MFGCRGIICFLMALLPLVVPHESSALEGASDRSFHTYLAAGPLFGIGSIRAGSNKWEMGLLTISGAFLGVNKILRRSEGAGYVAFGFGATVYGESSPGVYGAFGYDIDLFLGGLGLRAEVTGIGAANGLAEGGILLGLSWGI